MPYHFNPFTGKLDYYQSVAGATGTIADSLGVPLAYVQNGLVTIIYIKEEFLWNSITSTWDSLVTNWDAN